MNSTDQQTLFSNPVCKQTYDSLPKIYGGSKSSRSASRTKKSIIIRQIKQCFTSPHQNVSPDVKPPCSTRHFSLIKSRILSQPKGQKCRKPNCMCSMLHDQQIKAKRQTTKTSMQRKPKLKLKPLRYSKPDDFQSQHKVAMRISTQPNLPSGLNSLLGLNELRKARQKIEQNHKSKSELQNSIQKKEDNKNQRTQGTSKGIEKIEGFNQEVQGCLPRSLTQQILALRARKAAFENSAFLNTERDGSSNISKVCQKKVGCVEVQVNLFKQQQKETGIGTQTMDNYSPSIREKTNLSRNRRLIKQRQHRCEVEQDENGSEQHNKKKSQKSSGTKSRQSNSSLSLSSCLIKGLGDKSTEFQRLDLKQSNSKLKHSRTKSTNDDGSFKVPKKGQYASFLKSYNILDKKSFNLKELVKKSLFTIVQQEQGVFFGEYKDDHKNGSGIQVSGKQIFQGVFDKNVKIKGSERNIDGVYKGYFEQGKREGYGTFQWNNGEKFEGNWKNGVKQGFGIWRSPKGDYYEGEWHNNRQQGEGIFRHKNSTYQGQFMNFLKHGQGEERFANGDIYIGEYKEGKPDGEGKYIWEDQSRYQGKFKNGLRNGFGKWIEVNGNIYEGQFDQDFRHGQGRLQFQTGEVFEGTFIKGAEYKGKFKNNLGEVEEIDNSQMK